MNNKIVKKLALVSASLMLASTASVALPTQTVSAVSSRTMSKYTRKFHRVVVLKPIQVYRVHRGKYGYLNRYTKAYKLRPGDSTLIRYRGVEWVWTIGKSYKYCTLKGNFSWFDTYSKYTWISNAVLTNTTKNTRFYRFTWSQFRTLVRKGVLSDNYSKKKWRKTVRPLIKKWKPVTEKA